ncbi:MAG: HlyD family efflux transporter periplasmic adaptor subunit [Candidatus Bipolaricaulota bacterium]|nr:HlyD family efflux transporter periplasmic adaptor subunit [Candidatus Bipolaricaulota bacterium]
MKRRTWILIAAAVVVVAAGLTLWLTLGRSQGTSKTPSAAQSAVTVRRGDISNSLVVYGSVVPKQEYTFAFAGDRVKSILVNVGTRVTSGQTLVELDTTQQRLSLLQAQRSLAEAQASGVPADIKERELALEIARSNLDNATLKAPFAGVVTKITQATTSSGSWSLVLIDTSELYIEATVDQLDAPDVEIGQSATATIESLPDKTWPVELVEVGGMAQSSGNSTVVTVTAKLPEADPTILVGYTAQMEITTESATNVLLVPVSCVTKTGKGWTVMKLVDGEAIPQAVTVGVTSDTYVEITSGLQEGDQVQRPTASTGSTSSSTQSNRQSQNVQFEGSSGVMITDGPGMP